MVCRRTSKGNIENEHFGGDLQFSPFLSVENNSNTLSHEIIMSFPPFKADIADQVRLQTKFFFSVFLFVFITMVIIISVRSIPNKMQKTLREKKKHTKSLVSLLHGQGWKGEKMKREE